MKGQKRDSVVKRHGDLEIEESMQTQYRLWKVQRVVRAVAVILILCALAGVFGGGPLSHHVASDKNWAVSYERFSYFDTPQTYEITLNEEVAMDGKARVWLDLSLMDRIEIENVRPEPSSTKLDIGRTVFEFDLLPGGGTRKIYISYRAKKAGILIARMGIGETQLALKQLIWF